MYLDTHNNIIDEFVNILTKNSSKGNSFIIEKFETELKYVLLESIILIMV